MSFSDPGRPNKSKQASDITNEEAAHLSSLTEKKSAVSIKLVDGELVSGWIEYYDTNMVRLTRDGKPNLFIFKDRIAYIAEEDR